MRLCQQVNSSSSTPASRQKAERMAEGAWADELLFYCIQADGTVTTDVKLGDVLIFRHTGDSKLPKQESLRALLTTREIYSLVTRETFFLINSGFSLIILEQIPMVITRSDCYVGIPPKDSMPHEGQARISNFVNQLAAAMRNYDEWELDCLGFLLQYTLNEVKDAFRRLTRDASRMLLADSTGYKTLFDPCYQIKLCLDRYKTMLINLAHDDQVSRISLKNQDFIRANTQGQSQMSNLQLHVRTNSTPTGLHLGNMSYSSSTLLRPGSQANISNQADIHIIKKATFDDIDDDVLENLPVSVERIEKILEIYILESEMLHIEVIRMLSGFNMRMLIIQLRLDRRQNRILSYKVWIAFISVSIKLAALPSGFLGMNLLNPWLCDSDPKSAGPFYVPESLSPFYILFASSAAIFLACLVSLCLSYIGLRRSLKTSLVSKLL